MTDMEAVIRDAAIKNNVGLRVDDPVMVLVTIMNRIVEDQTEAMNAALTNYQATHEDIAHRWRQDAMAAAERILNAALDAGRESAANSMNEGLEKILELFRQECGKMAEIETTRLRVAVGLIRKIAIVIAIEGGIVMALWLGMLLV